jgi:hypothetical protein
MNSSKEICSAVNIKILCRIIVLLLAVLVGVSEREAVYPEF